MKVKSEREVAQSCLTLHDPMDCSPPGSSAHGIFQARVLEWGAIAFSMFLLSYSQKLKGKVYLTGRQFSMTLSFYFSCLISASVLDYFERIFI